jgi:tRNA(Ile)-lysidine synthetase-like protein
LAALPDPILARVLRKKLSEAGISAEREHLQETMKAIRSDAPHTSLSLPGGQLILDRDGIFMEKDKKEAPCFDVPLHVGLNELENGGCLYLAASDKDCQKDINTLKNIYKFETKASFTSATINRSLSARSRRAGDTLSSGGMRKSVKKLLQSLKMPLHERALFPFVTDSEEILWIPFLPVADSVRPSEGEKPLTIWYFSKK